MYEKKDKTYTYIGEDMNQWLLNLMNEYGYVGMFLGMVLEAIIIIIPSELILATGGILASKNIFTLLGAFLTGLLGSIFCAILIYGMGYLGGDPFIKKYGKYFFMKEEDIEKSNAWFQKYGLKAAFIGRNFPIVRTLISLPIGIMRLPFFPFLIYTAIGSIPWTFLFVFSGFLLGSNWIIVKAYMNYLKVPILCLLIGSMICFFLTRIVNRKKCQKK